MEDHEGRFRLVPRRPRTDPHLADRQVVGAARVDLVIQYVDIEAVDLRVWLVRPEDEVDRVVRQHALQVDPLGTNLLLPERPPVAVMRQVARRLLQEREELRLEVTAEVLRELKR